MLNLLLVMAGGAGGAVLRYWISLLAAHRLPAAFPWGTLSVNLIGCFAAGLVLGIVLVRGGEGDMLRLLVLTGFLGGFTTFSAFSSETAFMILNGDLWQAALYVGASTVGAILLTFLGLWLSGAGS